MAPVENTFFILGLLLPWKMLGWYQKFTHVCCLFLKAGHARLIANHCLITGKVMDKLTKGSWYFYIHIHWLLFNFVKFCILVSRNQQMRRKRLALSLCALVYDIFHLSVNANLPVWEILKFRSVQNRDGRSSSTTRCQHLMVSDEDPMSACILRLCVMLFCSIVHIVLCSQLRQQSKNTFSECRTPRHGMFTQKKMRSMIYIYMALTFHTDTF